MKVSIFTGYMFCVYVSLLPRCTKLSLVYAYAERLHQFGMGKKRENEQQQQQQQRRRQQRRQRQ